MYNQNTLTLPSAATDSTILNWSGDSSPLALIENNSSLSIASSALRDIRTTTGNSAAVSAREVAAFTPSTAAVTSSSLTRVVSPFFALERPGAARFYSDDGLLVRGTDGETDEAERLPAAQAGTPLLPAAGNPILVRTAAHAGRAVSGFGIALQDAVRGGGWCMREWWAEVSSAGSHSQGCHSQIRQECLELFCMIRPNDASPVLAGFSYRGGYCKHGAPSM